jgi:hypothetical protein
MPIDNADPRTKQLYDYVMTARKSGLSWETIKQDLSGFGASPELAQQIIDDLRKTSTQQFEVKSGDKLRKIRESNTRETGCFHMIMGAAICAVGIFITMFSYRAAARTGGFFIITYGLIFSGAAQFLLGMIAVAKGKH